MHADRFVLSIQGYDATRIVDVKPDDLEEFSCGICLNVLKEPMVVQCCRQTYCKDCIEEWLANNNTCPNDRQWLTPNGLTPAPRLLFNILNNMRIKCERHSDGCPVVTTIGTEEEHRVVCKYYGCNKCGFRGQAQDHDCIKYLLKVIDDLKVNKDNQQNMAKLDLADDDVSNSSEKVCQLEIWYSQEVSSFERVFH